MNPIGQVTAAARQTEEVTLTSMRVRKRNGSFEPVDINKIVRAISRCCAGLTNVDVMRIATKTISGLYDGATTQELDKLSIQTAAELDLRRAGVFAARPPACLTITSRKKSAIRKFIRFRNRSLLA